MQTKLDRNKELIATKQEFLKEKAQEKKALQVLVQSLKTQMCQTKKKVNVLQVQNV